MINLTKQIVIHTDDKIIFDSIEYNIANMSFCNDYKLKYLQDLSCLLHYSKIDLLITSNNDLISFNHSTFINTIILITDKLLNQNYDDVIILYKPFKLSHVLEIINHTINNSMMFCIINNKWIYNEKLGILKDSKSQYKLTDKEKDIFSYLLKTPDYKLNKHEFITKVWKYKANIDTNTVSSTINKLKNKLPPNLLNYTDNYYHLNIDSIT